MAVPQVLVIGPNRGVGLNILKAFASRSWDVTGTIRPQSQSDSSVDEVRSSTQVFTALMPLKRDSRFKRLTLLTSPSSYEQLKQIGVNFLEMDNLDEASVRQAASDYGDRPLDILVNDASKTILELGTE
ncbi:hypothetical protein Daus18300_003491 [Diaporthe australafricana]|uniref:Uncharacterized protein n=1 Tax=Diaporthe australafricana TaxID=127596 RepID=A0ABR3XEU8_9PEZI